MCTDGRLATIGIPGRLKSIAPRVISRYSTVSLGGSAERDTGESRGLIGDEHPSVVAAMRGAVMGQADLVVTIGRRLDFQLAYGSPAVFGDAKFLRIADCAAELRDNRRGDLGMLCDPALALQAILDAEQMRQGRAQLPAYE